MTLTSSTPTCPPTDAAAVRTARRQPLRRHRLVMAGLAVLLVGVLAVRVLLGDFTVTVLDFFRILGGVTIPGASYIVLEVRLPRALLAALVLGVAELQRLVFRPRFAEDLAGHVQGADGVVGGERQGGLDRLDARRGFAPVGRDGRAFVVPLHAGVFGAGGCADQQAVGLEDRFRRVGGDDDDRGERGIEAWFAEDSEAAGEVLADEVMPGDVVLVKGSRGVRTEKVIEKLLETFLLQDK